MSLLKKILLSVVAVIAALILAVAVIYLTGTGNVIVAAIWGPPSWSLSGKAPAPDYAKPNAWAALPESPGVTALRPTGVAKPSAAPRVDVFFIHPTGYMGGADWNSPLDPNSQTEENTQWMMANQASAFNGCCAIYAPRYRQASIFRYFAATPDVFKKSGDFAYADVERAFLYFLAHRSNGRPFIIASHSQGTEHGFTLIKRKIDGTPLAQRMVAAYLIGGGIEDKDVDGLKTVHACTSATALHCIIHWATHAEGATPSRENGEGKLLCINPLTWTRDGGLADASLHKGAVPISGEFKINFWGGDKPFGTKFLAPGAPLPKSTAARCHDGFLFASDQSKGPLARTALGTNYHGLDYPLFAMDIRANAQLRVDTYLHQTAATP